MAAAAALFVERVNFDGERVNLRPAFSKQEGTLLRFCTGGRSLSLSVIYTLGKRYLQPDIKHSFVAAAKSSPGGQNEIFRLALHIIVVGKMWLQYINHASCRILNFKFAFKHFTVLNFAPNNAFFVYELGVVSAPVKV